ncbi:MAG: hypothetical protein AB8B64_06150 [Granulosicoccus sp.]
MKVRTIIPCIDDLKQLIEVMLRVFVLSLQMSHDQAIGWHFERLASDGLQK